MIIKRIVFISIVISMIFYSSISSAHRPLATEDAGVGDLGEVVIEGAWEHVKENNDTENAAFMAIVLGLKYAEISVEGPYLWVEAEDENGNKKKESGPGDFTVFGKVLLLGSSEQTGMFTIKAEAKTTSGDEEKGLGSGIWEYAGSIVLSKQFASFIIHAQGGYAYVDDPDEDNAYFYGLAVDFLINDKFTLVAETFGSYNPEEKPVSIQGGLIVQPIDMIAFDMLAGKGMNDEADDWFFTAGFTLVL